MHAFAHLFDALAAMPDNPSRLALLADYIRSTPDPDRGYALALLSGALSVKKATPAMLRDLVAARMDPVLLGWCRDYVGDLVETVALVWQGEDAPSQPPPNLGEIIVRLGALEKREVPAFLAQTLDRLEPSARFAFLKIAGGGLRTGISGELVRRAVAKAFARPPEEIDAVWHASNPPWSDVFGWLEGRHAAPAASGAAAFRAPMQALLVGGEGVFALDPAAFAAEWQGGGPRLQLARSGGQARLFTPQGDDIAAIFADVLALGDFEGVLEGELRVAAGAQSGAGLRRRLARKTADRGLMRTFPATFHAGDILEEAGEDLRGLPFAERRARLEAAVAHLPPDVVSLSPQLAFSAWSDLEAMRRDPPAGASGLLLKRRDGLWRPGQEAGNCLLWRREPFRLEAVLLYARTGRSGGAGDEGDFTFGLWGEGEAGPQLVPIGRAGFAAETEGSATLDRYVRENVLERFGPVRSVLATPRQGLVAELAFEAADLSTRHRCGFVLRGLRILRLRPDMLPSDVMPLSALGAMAAD